MPSYAPEARHLRLGLHDAQGLYTVAHALANEMRIQILQLLSRKGSMNVNEIARELQIPNSTSALNVRVLQEAGLIQTEIQPGLRGAMKVCSSLAESIAIFLNSQEESASRLKMSMGVGCYSLAEVKPPCALVNSYGPIGAPNDPRSFYDPDRFHAQMLCLREGYLEYHFANKGQNHPDIAFLEIAFEASSIPELSGQGGGTGLDLMVNEVYIGRMTLECPRLGRGHSAPQWWRGEKAQCGKLYTWRIDREGTCLNGVPQGGASLKDLDLMSDQIRVRIATAPEEGDCGINLYGERFGESAQGILLTVGHRIPSGEAITP